jgi:hypothetical protein
MKLYKLILCLLLWTCNQPTTQKDVGKNDSKSDSIIPKILKNEQYKIIHVFVALCDNEHQGIQKVPPKIGNGKDPENNLYWGCDLGVKTYIKNQKNWKLLETVQKPREKVLERCIFRYKTENILLIADAYDGEFIKKCTSDFLQSCSGNYDSYVVVNKDSVACGGNSDLLGYIGHDGLMEFKLTDNFKPRNNRKRETIILACYSKGYFEHYLKKTGAESLIYTTGLMAPEAYSLLAATEGWISKRNKEEIKELTAQAYHKYQKCGIKAARNLFVND